MVAVLKTVIEKSFWKEFFRTFFLFYVFREKKICLVELIKEYRQVKQKIQDIDILTKKILNLYKKIKELVKHLPTLHLPLESEYKIIQTDDSQTEWGGILLQSLTLEKKTLYIL